MRIIRRRAGTARCRALLLASILFAPAVAWGADPGAEVSVIVNEAVPDDERSLGSVRAMFSMRVKAWPDGTPVRVFVLPDRDELHVAFAKQVLRVYPYVLRETWDKLVFTGAAQAPIEVQDEITLQRRVASTPGAIGYVRGKPKHEKTKTLEIR